MKILFIVLNNYRDKVETKIWSNGKLFEKDE